MLYIQYMENFESSMQEKRLQRELHAVNVAVLASYEKHVQYGKTSPLVAQEHDQVAEIISVSLQRLAQYSDEQLEQAVYRMNDAAQLRDDRALPKSSPLEERIVDVLVRLANVVYVTVLQKRRSDDEQETDQLIRSNLYRRLASLPFRKERAAAQPSPGVTDIIAQLREQLGMDEK